MSEKSVPAPNHTQTPNVFFDDMLSEIDTMSELKVTLAIIRQTFGWHKDKNHISLSQLEKMTGMGRQQVVAGCKAALARGYVWREKYDGKNFFGLRVGGYDDHTPMRNAHGYDDHTNRGYDDHTHKRKEKESTPTGQAAPDWNEAKIGEKQSYLIGYLNTRFRERGMDPPTPRQKERLSGELRTHIKRGRSKADLLFALDHMVEAARRGVVLEFYQAIADADQKANPSLRVLRGGRGPSEQMVSIDGYREFS